MRRSLTRAYEFVIECVMDLSADFRNWRDDRGISQAAVATACGVDQSTVSLWETGRNGPSGSARILLDRFIAEHQRDPLVRQPTPRRSKAQEAVAS